jgi:hypothetical protein
MLERKRHMQKLQQLGVTPEACTQDKQLNRMVENELS